jgi:pilus assembly protein CpaB
MRKQLVLVLVLGLAVFTGGASAWAEAGGSQNTNGKSIAGLVRTQMRGVLVDSIPNTVGQMVAVGDHVDVLVTLNATMKDGNKENITVTLLQDVEVLAAGVQPVLSDQEESKYNGYVILALTPRDAQYLALSRSEGVVDVIVRNPGDTTKYIMEVSSFAKLFQ